MEQVRGGLVIVSEIRESLTFFTRVVMERDMLHGKGYSVYSKNNQSKGG